MEQQRRPITVEDHWALRLVTDLHISPDGKEVAYTVGRFEEATNTLRSAVWLAEVDTGRTRQVTSGEALDSQPRWSPGGSTLAFVSTRHEGTPQIFFVDAGGGEARRVTSAVHGAHTPVWSPDGTRLCFSSTEPTDVQRVPQEQEWLRSHPDADLRNPLRRQTALWSRMDPAGWMEKRTHLYVMDVNDWGTPRQLTGGDADALGAAWSPDGKAIAFASARSKDREHTSFAADIWTVDPTSGEERRLTNEDLAASLPAWSPDGQSIAFYARPHWHPEGFRDMHLWLVSRQGGDQRDITPDIDLTCGRGLQPDYLWVAGTPPEWSPDGSRIYFSAVQRGDTAIFTVTPQSGQTSRLNPDHADIVAFRLAPDGDRLACIAATPTRPYDVWTLPATGGTLQPLGNTNAALLERVTVVEPEHIQFRAADGLELEGWLYRPAEASEPTPLLLHVHGGPHGTWGHSFYFEAQAEASAGYASLYVNPRGGIGYGESFTDRADWGQKDFEDLMTGVDVALARGGLDPERLGITGISYGGFMTNWSLGHTERFGAGVAINGISNFVSFYGVSDIGALWFEGTYLKHFGPRFWTSEDVLARYRARSPITYVENISAPLLLIQSENDYRCPIEQGEQIFTALRMRRQPVELVRFPGCAHAIASTGTPLQRYLQWKLTLDWFQHHIPARLRQEVGAGTS